MTPLCYAVHVSGAQQFDGRTLPTFGEAAREYAFAALAMLKRADPESLVTVVAWEDDGVSRVARDDEEAFEGMAQVLLAAGALRDRARAGS